MKNLSIIIPCYNESDNIINLFDKLSELIKLYTELQIVIVENGSKDNSITKIKNHPLYKNNLITLVEIDKNLGYGHGIMSGVYKSTTKYIAWCHADLQTSLKDVCDAFEKNLDKLEKTKSIVKGKRINRSIVDKFFSSGMSVITSFLFKCNCSSESLIISHTLYLSLFTWELFNISSIVISCGDSRNGNTFNNVFNPAPFIPGIPSDLSPSNILYNKKFFELTPYSFKILSSSYINFFVGE